jgi:calretinin
MSEERRISNFLQTFRDKETRRFQNFTAKQFMEVWLHYDTDGNGYIEGSELDGFLREFVRSVVPGDVSDEVVSEAALEDLKQEIMLAYDENGDNRIEIGELAQMLPTDENFLVLFRRDAPLESSVEFMRIWKKFDQDSSGYIESEELKEFLRFLLKQSKKEVSEDKLEEYSFTILKLFDTNGDGKLQLSEMARLLPVKENFLSKPLFRNAHKLSSYDIDRIFRKYDTDRSGTIENEELEGLMIDLLELTGEQYDAEKMQFFREVIMQQWDVDNDGKIGRKELKMILLQHSRMPQDQ